MRNISPTVRNILDNADGIEPILVAGIKWNNDFTFYADRTVLNGDEGIIYGKIIQFGALEAVTRLDSNGSATSISFVLDDTDGTIKNYFDHTTLHYIDVIIYQYFEGTSFNDMVLLFEGKLVSPMSWSEGERTVTLTAITRQVGNLVGFALDESVGPYNQNLISQAWPVCFGTPEKVPCLQLQELPTGTTTIAFGVPDPSIQLQLNEMDRTSTTMTDKQPPKVHSIIGGRELPGLLVAIPKPKDPSLTFFDTFPDDQSGTGFIADAHIPLQPNPMDSDYATLMASQKEQQKWWKPNNLIIGGYKFPQWQKILIKIGEQLFYAIFKGTGELTHPDQPCPVTLKPYYDSDPFLTAYTPTEKTMYRRLAVQQTGFTFFQAGSKVELIDKLPNGFKYVASITPGKVKAVYAERSFNGLKQLTVVPSQYYTIEQMPLTPMPGGNAAPLTATIINFPRTLSTITYFANLKTQNIDAYLQQTNYRDIKFPNYKELGQGLGSHIIDNVDWSNEIYVTFESDIGPNIIDIMRWIITNYTPYTTDQDSFDYVWEKLQNFPANFALLERTSADEVLSDIARQCCCAVWLKNNKYYVKYLRDDFNPITTITEDDIEQNTMVVDVTDTENLVTKFVAVWRPDYYVPENRLILQRNTAVYGIHEEDNNFNIFNDYNIVNKMATYWLIIKSNIWKRVSCDVMINKLEAETMDDVLLDFSRPFVSEGSVPARVEQSLYDSNTNTIKLSLWLPVLQGQMQAYIYATPANISTSQLTPYFEPITSGGGAGFTLGKQYQQTGTPSYRLNTRQVTVNGRTSTLFTSGGWNPPFRTTEEIMAGLDMMMSDQMLGGAPIDQYSEGETPTTEVNTQTPPTFSYDFPIFIPSDEAKTKEEQQAEELARFIPKIGCYPGTAIGGGGGTYQMQLYKGGTNGTQVVTAQNVGNFNPSEKDIIGKNFLVSAVYTTDKIDPEGQLRYYFVPDAVLVEPLSIVVNLLLQLFGLGLF